VSESNKALVRSYYERVVNEHRLDELASFIHPNYVDHNCDDAGRGPSVARAHLVGLRGSFPDFRLRIEQVIAEGDFVATRVSASGEHSGVWQQIEPTGDRIELRGINFDRIEAGLIIEHWGEADTIGMLWQMGVDPFAVRRS
jgi:predicted ester cyclase